VNIDKKDVSIEEIKSIFENRNGTVGDTIYDLMKCFNMAKLCRSLGVNKQKGYSLPALIIVLTLFPVMLLKTVRGFILSGCKLIEAQKDTFFRIKNNEHMNWRKFLYAVNKQFQNKLPENEEPLTPTENEGPLTPTCGIVDDTLLEKTGDKIEGIGKVHDHVTKKHVLGFKCQVYAYWDGKSIRPLDFSLHAEIGKKKERPFGMTKKQLKRRFKKDRSPKSQGYKRFKELTEDKISAALAAIKRGAKNGYIPKYLLADSWYTGERFITTIRAIKNGAIHFLGMAPMGNRYYKYQGQRFDANKLRTFVKSKSKRCRKLKATYIEVVVEYKDAGKVKLFFSRYSKRGKWQLMLTTDLSLSYIKAVKTYNNRWSIEVLFKECKQHLNLGACQSNDFDAQIAAVTLSLVLYTMLSFHKRVHSYETMGALFAKLKDQMIESTIAERLWDMFIQILIEFAQLFDIEPSEQFKKILHADEILADLERFYELRSSARMEEYFNKAA